LVVVRLVMVEAEAPRPSSLRPPPVAALMVSAPQRLAPTFPEEAVVLEVAVPGCSLTHNQGEVEVSEVAARMMRAMAALEAAGAVQGASAVAPEALSGAAGQVSAGQSLTTGALS
jgi:hypothetical protein